MIVPLFLMLIILPYRNRARNTSTLVSYIFINLKAQNNGLASLFCLQKNLSNPYQYLKCLYPVVDALLIVSPYLVRALLHLVGSQLGQRILAKTILLLSENWQALRHLELSRSALLTLLNKPLKIYSRGSKRSN